MKLGKFSGVLESTGFCVIEYDSAQSCDLCLSRLCYCNDMYIGVITNLSFFEAAFAPSKLVSAINEQFVTDNKFRILRRLAGSDLVGRFGYLGACIWCRSSLGSERSVVIRRLGNHDPLYGVCSPE